MKVFYEAIFAHGGFAGDVFDIAVGPANIDVIDVLLSIGDGTLTQNIPINIISTGLLHANRALDLSGAEQNGKMAFLSIRNTDIAIHNITIMPSGTINGLSSLTVTGPQDYILVHETAGVWRAYFQQTTAGGGGGGGGGSGPTTITRPYTPGTSLLDAVYQKSDGTVAPASAMAGSYMPCIGFVSAMDMPSAGLCSIQQDGDLSGFSGLTPAYVYVVSLNMGQLLWEGDNLNPDYPAVTAPGTIVQPVAVASSTSTINIIIGTEIIN